MIFETEVYADLKEKKSKTKFIRTLQHLKGFFFQIHSVLNSLDLRYKKRNLSGMPTIITVFEYYKIFI